MCGYNDTAYSVTRKTHHHCEVLNVSQGSVETCFRCGGVFIDDSIRSRRLLKNRLAFKEVADKSLMESFDEQWTDY